MDLEFKAGVIEQCKKEVLEKMMLCENLLSDLKKDISNETKSSAGDKFETSREMMQQEREKAEAQIQRLNKSLYFLESISGEKSSKVESGAMIRSGNLLLFFVPGFNNLEFEDKKIYTAAINSPIGQALKALSLNEKVIFNGKTYRIDEIC